MRRFSVTAVLIVGAASLAMLAPFVMKDASELSLRIVIIGLQIIWFAALVWSIRFGKRSLWFFASAPFALFWPWTLLVLMTISCTLGSCVD